VTKHGLVAHGRIAMARKTLQKVLWQVETLE